MTVDHTTCRNDHCNKFTIMMAIFTVELVNFSSYKQTCLFPCFAIFLISSS